MELLKTSQDFARNQEYVCNEDCSFVFFKCFDRILRSVHKPKFKLYIAFNTSLLSLH